MLALFSLGVLALILCLVLTPLCRNLFLRWNIVDIPDHRKVHTKPIPRIGGIPIALSYGLAVIIMMWFAPKSAVVAVQHKNLLWSVFPAVGVVFLTGLADDLWGLKATHKLVLQIVAAGWAVMAGAQIHLLEGHAGAHWLMYVVSILWLVGCTNAFNLIDGLDGLASGVGLFATLTTLLAALLQGNWGLAMATVPLAGCLLGFLRYNFNPASVFLGDSGSLTIGFLLGCFGVIWSQKSATLLGMLAPLMAFSLPLFEVGLSILRRFLRNQPIFQPDRGHIHHKLLGLGLHPRAVALILYAACGIAAVLSLLQSSMSYNLGGLIIILFCCLSWFGIRRLDYIEFRTAGRVLRRGKILQLLESEIYLEHLRTNLASAKSLEECWIFLQAACEELEFASVRMQVDGETYSEVFDQSPVEPTWHVRVQLKRDGNIVLTREAGKASLDLSALLRLLEDLIDSARFADDFDMQPDSRSISLLHSGERIPEAS